MKNKKQSVFRAGKFILLFLFLGGIIASCSKDKDSVEEDTVNRSEFEQAYFSINAGSFKGRALPASNSESLEIANIRGNETILAGGSNLITITGSENATEVIVGIKGQDGFFTVPMGAGRETANRGVMATANLQLLIGQGASDTFTIAFALSDGQGNVSEFQYLVVNLLRAGTGLLQVSLLWDQLNDVDLHLIDPNGEEIYFANRTSSTGGYLDVDSNPACYIDEINNENIFYEDNEDVTVPTGEYEVLVDLWSNCDIVPDTAYSIVVTYGGIVIQATEGQNPTSGMLSPDTTEMVSVMKFNIDGTAPKGNSNANQITLPQLYRFSFDKNNKVFNNFSPKKQ